MEPLKAHTRHASILIFLLILVIGAMFGLKRCVPNRAEACFKNSVTDTIVVALAYSPHSFYMDGDSLTGFDYELLHIIAEAHNLNFRYVPINTPKSIDSTFLRYDILATDISSTVIDTTSFILTQPIYTSDSTTHYWAINKNEAISVDSLNYWIYDIKRTHLYELLTKRYFD
jgi:hypothetical protein